MSIAILITVLSVGLARGFLHALDPDHVMTIAALSSRQNAAQQGTSQHGTSQIGKPMQYAVLWSAGHGVMIIAAASLVIFTGQHLPEAVSASAETIVGVILIVTGASVLWSVHRGQNALSAGNQEPVPSSMVSSGSKAAPLTIGFIHGLAGSASLMALVPITLIEPGSRFAFALVFCAGVLAAMLAFSLLYDRLQQLLVRLAQSYVQMLQTVVGFGSIALGAFWLIWG